MTAPDPRRVLVLGASGLIGHFIATDLMGHGHQVIAVARRFTQAQRLQFGSDGWESPIVNLPADALAALLRESRADVVVNCLGQLQGAGTSAVHDGFIDKLIQALRIAGRPILLVHVSIPGNDADDRTDFSRSKRSADRLIIASGLPYAILRPGFVFAPNAFGGSALMRALAALPFDLPDREGSRTFSYVAIEDVAETVDVLVRGWETGQPAHAVVWDLMHPEKETVAGIVGRLRHWLGTAPKCTVKLPQVLLNIGGKAGDLAAWLGWSPPIRSTPLSEMRRGVDGDPAAWLAATGLTPRSFGKVLAVRPASIQEKWFARLYLLKAAIVACLAVFWCASGLIALTVAYPAAVDILASHGFPPGQAHAMTIASSVTDFLIGVAIVFRRTHRLGLYAGIAVSLFYMFAAAIVTPDLWIEPLGALVKTFPAIVLMVVALALNDER